MHIHKQYIIRNTLILLIAFIGGIVTTALVIAGSNDKKIITSDEYAINMIIALSSRMSNLNTQEKIAIYRSKLIDMSYYREALGKLQIKINSAKVEAERLLAIKIEEERLEEERLEKERLEKERLEKERLEKARIEAEAKEKERLEKERLQKIADADAAQKKLDDAKEKERLRILANNTTTTSTSQATTSTSQATTSTSQATTSTSQATTSTSQATTNSTTVANQALLDKQSFENRYSSYRDITLGQGACFISNLDTIYLTSAGYLSPYGSSHSTLSNEMSYVACLKKCDIAYTNYPNQDIMYCHYEGRKAITYSSHDNPTVYGIHKYSPGIVVQDIASVTKPRRALTDEEKLSIRNYMYDIVTKDEKEMTPQAKATQLKLDMNRTGADVEYIVEACKGYFINPNTKESVVTKESVEKFLNP